MVSSENETSLPNNVTMNSDEVGKIESIKFRDGTQCTIDGDDDDDEPFLSWRGMCIAGQCQVSARSSLACECITSM
jgi:hypothetical protein